MSLARLQRRTAALVAVPALALGVVAALPAGSAQAAVVDPAPVSHGATWLAGQLTGGLLHNPNFGGFDDYGLSIDAGTALAVVGGHPTDVDSISTALAANIGSYVGDGTTESYSGALGKAAVFARISGDDPTSYGGVDLVSRLEARVGTTGPTAGRIADASAYGDFANPIGQAFAARALDEAGSSLGPSATDFLLEQQCSAGYFRAQFADPTAPDQTCDGDPSSAPSVDVTALAVLQLEEQADDPVVQTAINDAVTWLVGAQAADGSFGSSAPTTAANANSTGLAGWALTDEGTTPAATQAATEAAVWLRGVQADDPAACRSGVTGDTGAIAYDRAALVAGRSDGITVDTQDQFRRASTQALPALRSAPAGTYATAPTSPSGFVRPRSRQTLRAVDLAPGQTVCFARGTSHDLVNAGVRGTATGHVVIASGSGVRTYTVGLTDGVLGRISFHALDAKTFPVDLRKRVAVGRKQVVTVHGLATGEKAQVVFHGVKHTGRGNGAGEFTTSFGVGRSAGKTTFRVVGQFADRTAVKKFTVTR